MFNAIGSLGEIGGARVVDLFAGSGAMGIEALSRGAAHCTFVERDRAAVAVLRRNLASLGVDASASVVEADAATHAARVGSVDILIADPPYGFSEWEKLLAGADAALVVLESDRDPGPIAEWTTVRSKRYGRTHVTFLRPGHSGGGTVEGE